MSSSLAERTARWFHRVEGIMIRIGSFAGIIDNALMPVAIFFSIENTNVSRMKRNLRVQHNIEKVCDVNQVSRQLVTGESAFRGFWWAELHSKLSCPITTSNWLLPQRSVLPSSPSCLAKRQFAFSLLCWQIYRIPLWQLLLGLRLRTTGSCMDALFRFCSQMIWLLRALSLPLLSHCSDQLCAWHHDSHINSGWAALWIIPHHSCSQCRCLCRLLIMK